MQFLGGEKHRAGALLTRREELQEGLLQERRLLLLPEEWRRKAGREHVIFVDQF